MELPKRKNGESASRLIVEFGISNHNVLRQQELKRKPKKVSKVSITQEEKKEEKETFDLKKEGTALVSTSRRTALGRSGVITIRIGRESISVDLVC